AGSDQRQTAPLVGRAVCQWQTNRTPRRGVASGRGVVRAPYSSIGRVKIYFRSWSLDTAAGVQQARERSVTQGVRLSSAWTAARCDTPMRGLDVRRQSRSVLHRLTVRGRAPVPTGNTRRSRVVSSPKEDVRQKGAVRWRAF